MAIFNMVLSQINQGSLELLWTNSSPTSSVAADASFSILDASDYNVFVVRFCASTSLTTQYWDALALKNLNAEAKMTQTSGAGQTTYDYFRSFIITDSQITMLTTGYRDSTSNTIYCIPVSVWGIKG